MAGLTCAHDWAYSHPESPSVCSLWSGSKYYVSFFGLMRFLFTLQFSKKSPIICQHTNQCAKIVQSLDKKVWGGVKWQRQKKMWKVPEVCESKQSWMSSAICFLELDRADVRALSSQIHHSLTKAPTVLYGKLSQQKTPAEILRHPLVSA